MKNNHSLFEESKEQSQSQTRKVKEKNDSFFEESKEQSQIKARIVKNYLWAWAKIIMPWASNRIAYIDLFSGPGRYKNGKKSTPILVLETAIEDKDMKEMLVTLFNDADSNHSDSLSKAIDSIPNIGWLKHQPVILNREVGEEIIHELEERDLIPTLCFIDPWGYKGVSLRLIKSVLKDWGCDCIFFFNYNRINAGLANSKVEEHMNALFSEDRVKYLKIQISSSPYQKEQVIMEAMEQALKGMGGKYVLSFCFKSPKTHRTSHYIIFVTKHVRGYEIMKEIMAKESSGTEQGVPSFEYNPNHGQLSLLKDSPLDTLKAQLLKQFAGRTMTRKEVYEQHHIGTYYIKENYRNALLQLEKEGNIITNPPAIKRRKQKGEVTLSEKKVKITFPSIT
jgi:three-Cys-motif partner protein